MARRKGIEFNDRQKLMSALVEALYNRKTSFTLGTKHYQYNDEQHVRNTLNKLRREEFNSKQGITNSATKLSNPNKSKS